MAWEGLGSWWSILAGKELDARELRSLSGLSDAKSFRQPYPCRDTDAGLAETTIPDRLRNRHQRYRLTRLGMGVGGTLG